MNTEKKLRFAYILHSITLRIEGMKHGTQSH
jgi:hypothetical protein